METIVSRFRGFRVWVLAVLCLLVGDWDLQSRCMVVQADWHDSGVHTMLKMVTATMMVSIMMGNFGSEYFV